MTANFQTLCNGAVCQFKSTSTDVGGTITSYSWSGTGGVTGTGSTLTHTYTAGGNYTMKLTVTDSRGKSSTSITTMVDCISLFSVFCFG